MKLHIDIETFSSVDIKKCGAYKYVESPGFEILLVAFAVDDSEVRIVDLAQGEKLPEDFLSMLRDPDVEKHAHNATFERICFRAVGLETNIKEWRCSAIQAAYCGLPLGLDAVSKVLNLGDKAKLETGKKLIPFFSCPIKATKKNGGRTRNLPSHDLEKWGLYKEYCKRDVIAEREVGRILERYSLPASEWGNYALDQQINDRGIKVDLDFAQSASYLDGCFVKDRKKELQELTGLSSSGSDPQLKGWLKEATGQEIKSLAKEFIPELLVHEDPRVREAISLRQHLKKTSNAKYPTMLAATCDDGRAHGLFQFYGANRTGRWAGRLIQMQNLPQNHLKHIESDRAVINEGDYDLAGLFYDNVASVISQLIRTSFVAEPGHTFAVADFSAIEARVIAWLAGEKWRLDVFSTHGKIYEASASMMFNVPIEAVTKDSDYRAKGKVAELALGYQGGVGALKTMGGERMGLSDAEMRAIVGKWREANPSIKRLWSEVEEAAIEAIKSHSRVPFKKNMSFAYDGNVLKVTLPSGRGLHYWKARLTPGKYGGVAVKYQGLDQQTQKWGWVDSYGGKFTENIVQAIARDLLAEALKRLDDSGFATVMHVHDEAACEIPDLGTDLNEHTLDVMCEVMSITPEWAHGLPLAADGYITPFYKKD